MADYLHRECNVPVFSIGDEVRKIAHSEDVAPTSENLHEISQRYMFLSGGEFFTQRIIQQVEERNVPLAVIIGIRSPADVKALKRQFGKDFLLVYVKVDDPIVRYSRSRKRDTERDPRSFGHFLREEKEENELFHMKETGKFADITVENKESLEDFHKQIEKLIIKPLINNFICKQYFKGGVK